MTRPKEKLDDRGEFARLESDRTEMTRRAPSTGHEIMGPTDHFVQFYETDSFLLSSLSGFFGTGLDIGDSCIVVANSEHRERLETRLHASGRDIDLARGANRFFSIDDGELLSEFMVDGKPDAALFYDSIGTIIESAAAAGSRVRVFGEMVARLWAEKNHSAAIQVEELWNKLAERYPFALYCAYPLRAFDGDGHAEPLFHICNGHTRVIPGESYTALYEAEDRLRTIVMLQQKAARLEAEIAKRQDALINERLARAEAEKASRLKDQFLSTVSHELRTPLNVIVGWATMLRDGKLDASAQKRAFQTIADNARQQSRLIDDILDVSRTMSGKMQLNIGEVDLHSVISETLRSIGHAAEARGVNIEFKPGDLPMEIRADRDRLQQIFWNLISNAIKFTPQNGTVSISTRVVDRAAEVEVCDTGRGIEADFLPFIFDRFSQADGSRTREKGGLGLGLSLVRHLVELHGGSVWAASAGRDQGSAFTVRLPIQDASDPA
ncbi:MAG TPA: ATP-binding protein [Pyrinomonadaceae bacterium]|jgi:signal transduction histidine kinase